MRHGCRMATRRNAVGRAPSRLKSFRLMSRGIQSRRARPAARADSCDAGLRYRAAAVLPSRERISHRKISTRRAVADGARITKGKRYADMYLTETNWNRLERLQAFCKE